jgi:cytidylate kinase
LTPPASPPEDLDGHSPAPVIAIDGPVASGKTAVGLRLARDLRYRLVDTGMMYRAVTWLALESGISPQDEAQVVSLAETIQIELGQPGASGAATINVNGKDVTKDLRSPDVDRSVSYVSRMPGVRRAMVRVQRSLAGEGDLIMLGRDIGTVVLPDAPLKVYLDASPEVRAKRRHVELKESGLNRPEADILDELRERDRLDSERHTSPLRPADDAIIIDTDGLSLDEVVQRVREAARA